MTDPDGESYISIHAPRTGSDETTSDASSKSSLFQSTLPARGATRGLRHKVAVLGISIHAPRTGSDITPCTRIVQSTISIHAPRTGSDREARNKAKNSRDFNPRSPHGERHGSPDCIPERHPHFNPRSPHGERRLRKSHRRHGADFNPRSPHGERLALVGTRRTKRRDFNPRSPHGERHRQPAILHPLQNHFNPRSPHGERPTRGRVRALPHLFQSTLPARGATLCFLIRIGINSISIHAPRTGSDKNQPCI